MADAPAGGNAPPAERLPEFNPGQKATAPNLGPATDEAYTKQLAKLEFQLNGPLAGDREAFTNAQTTYTYNNSLYNRQEPTSIGKERFRAVLGGWGNSGIQAANAGEIRANYLAKRTANLAKRQEAETRYGRQGAELIGRYNTGLGEAIGQAQTRYKNQQVKLAPQEPQPITAAGGGPPGSSVTAGPGSPGQPIRAGFRAAEYGVGQGTDKPIAGGREAQRKEAARKARKR